MSSERRRTVRDHARTLAEPQDGVVSRAMLRRAGIDRFDVRREVRAGRWRTHGRQCVAVHTGDLSPVARRWQAVWEVGSGAALDGVSALCAAGLEGFREDLIHVSVPNTSKAPAVSGVLVHRVRRESGEIHPAGVPRVRPHVAAVRAAHWAVSDRQAALVLCMTVQQRIAPAARMADACARLRARGRISFIRTVVSDLAWGAESLGELDFARLCRRRGLPEPDRQVVRQGPRGRIYLDVRWDVGLVVEIDGAQHRQGLAVSADHLRRNGVALEGDLVLTIDLVGLRLHEDEFLDQVEEAHARLARRRAGHPQHRGA